LGFQIGEELGGKDCSRHDDIGILWSILVITHPLAKNDRFGCLFSPSSTRSANECESEGEQKESENLEKGSVCWLWAWGVSNYAFLVFGTFDYWPEGFRAWTDRYGVEGCSASDYLHSSQSPHRSWDCVFGGLRNVIKADALPFFIATTITLYARAKSVYARKKMKSVRAFLMPTLVGATAFFVSIHFRDWSGYSGIALVSKVSELAWHEVTTSPILLMALSGKLMALSQDTMLIAMSGKLMALSENAMGGVDAWTWIKSEFIQLDCSFYKMGSLYPKVLFVFLTGDLTRYAIER
jgi:hypothetical protein